MKRVLGCSTSTSPTVRSAAGQQRERALREAGFQQHLGELGGDGGGLARRLDDGRVARHQRGHRHARQDGQREVPWRNHHAHAQRDVDHLVALAGKLVAPAAGRPGAAFRGRSTRRNRWLRKRRLRLRARSCRPPTPARRRTPSCGRAGCGRPPAAGGRARRRACGSIAGSTRARLPRRGWPARAWLCGGCPRLRADSRG